MERIGTKVKKNEEKEYNKDIGITINVIDE
jgi:hypothetical protein